MRQVFRGMRSFVVGERDAPTEQHADVKTESPPNEEGCLRTGYSTQHNWIQIWSKCNISNQ